jgi:ketosteroid isomerase-like protein
MFTIAGVGESIGAVMSNIATVQDIYDAFGKGDGPRVLSHISEDVVWEYGGAVSDVPWLQPRKGREGAADFLASLADLRMDKFQPKTFLESGDLVVVVLDIEATVVSTGRAISEEDQIHLWHFNGDGQVQRFRHRTDTLQAQRACRPESV